MLPHHIPGEYGKTICKTANVKLQTIARVLYVKCAVELFLTFLISNKGEFCSVALSVDMNTATADRPFGVRVEAFKQQFHKRIFKLIMVSVEKEVPVRHLETEPRGVLFFL